MSQDDEYRAYFVHLRDEHRRLHEAVQQIRSLLLPPSAAHERLLAALRELRDELAEHFAEEEHGGCIEEALARTPTLAKQAREIESQHPFLLAELDRIIQGVAVLDKDEIDERFGHFADRLLAHETLENHIVSQGFNVCCDMDET